MDIQNTLANIPLDSTQTVGGSLPTYWPRIVAQLENTLPLDDRELDLSALTEWTDRARILLGFLVPDVRWLPFPWPAHGNYRADSPYQFGTLVLPFAKGQPAWWRPFVARTVATLSRVLGTLDVREPCELRGSAREYNEIAAQLLTNMEALSDAVVTELAGAYFLDPWNATDTLWPLLRRDTPDALVWDIHQRYYVAMFGPVPDTSTFYGQHAARMTNDEKRKSYGNMVKEWVGMRLAETVYADKKNGDVPWPPHYDFSRRLFARPDMLAHARLDVSDVVWSIDRYPEPHMDEALHTLARTVILSDTFDWSPEYRMHERYGASGLVRDLLSVSKRFPEDKELQRALQPEIARARKKVQARRDAANAPPPAPVVLKP
jgi:hypothetical protein